MGVSFIHTADCHIGMSFGNASFSQELGRKRREELKETFFLMLDHCIEQEIDFFMIAGDLFEEEYITMSELKDLQRKFASMANVHIIICAGNHDAITSENSNYNLVKWSSNVHILRSDYSKVSIEALNVDIYGISWDTKHIREKDKTFWVIEDPSKYNVLMLHGDAYNKNNNYFPLKIDELLDIGFDYIALGHIHKSAILHECVAYCGSPEPLDFKETGSHGFIKGIIEGQAVRINFFPFSKREFFIIEVTINEDMSFEEIKKLVYEAVEADLYEDGMYRVVINGVKGIDVIINESQIKEYVERNIFYCEIIDKTQDNYDLHRIKRNNKGNIIDEFIRYMEDKGIENPQIKDALYEGLMIMLGEKVD